MTEKIHQQLKAFSNHLSARREEILNAWQSATEADTEQTTVDSLTRSQFYDHIPQVLEALGKKLRARRGDKQEAEATEEETQEEKKHGLQRWQQGYRLREITREWGHLHICLTRELEVFAATTPQVRPETVTEAQCRLISLVNNAISESVSQYLRMERETAAGRANDLQQALTELSDVERQRGMLIREAVHDLGGSVQAVTSAAAILGHPNLPDDRRAVMTGTIERGVKSLRTMLGELMGLARLEAGQERRQVASFDVGKLLVEFCDDSQTTAQEHGLWLQATGPQPLEVEGDADKIHRIVQNLVNNALRYTEQGGVKVSWGCEGAEQWWVAVKDTGPGLLGGPGAPILQGLKEATSSARESDEMGVKSGAASGHVLPQSAGAGVSESRQRQGEGIGLAIVKRLCDLLNASLEVASSSEEGTTFRVLLPSSYRS